MVGVSALGGLWPALATAVAGFLLVNWYFTPPLYTFTIGETENVLALFVFLAVAVVVSLLVSLAARRAVEGARARAEAQALVRLAGSSTVAAVLDALVRTLGLQGASVLHRREDGWLIEGAAGCALRRIQTRLASRCALTTRTSWRWPTRIPVRTK